LSGWPASLDYLGIFLGPLIGYFTSYLAPWPPVIIILSHILDPMLVYPTVARGVGAGTAAYDFENGVETRSNKNMVVT